MSSNSISVQGIGFGPESTASQGFLGESNVALLSGTATISISGIGALSQSEPIIVDFGGRLRRRDIERIRRIKEDDDEIAAVVSAALITLRMQNYDRTN